MMVLEAKENTFAKTPHSHIILKVDDHKMEAKSQPAYLFGVDMNYFPRSLQLFICIVLIFFLFILYGYCQVCSKFKFEFCYCAITICINQ